MKGIKESFFAVVATTLISVCATPATSTQIQENQIVKSSYAPINGIKMYYEIHGSGGGIPLLLLNGGGSTIEVTYSKLLPILAHHREVIALEEQGHGLQ